MYTLFSVLVAFVLPFGITAERYIVTCDNGEIACSPPILQALEDAGATVIDNFPFGVSVIEADEDLDSVVSGGTVSLDFMVQLDASEDFEATLADTAPLNQGATTTKKDGEGRRRRLQMKSPPDSEEQGKCSIHASICRPICFDFCMDPSPVWHGNVLQHVLQRSSRLCCFVDYCISRLFF
jgi:hypothetical protein